MAWRLLRNRAVQDLIHTLRQEALDAARVTVNRLAQAMGRGSAFADRRDLFDTNGALLPPHQWLDDIASAVEAIEVEDGRPVEVKTAKRMDALRALAQWRKMIGADAPKAAAEKGRSVVEIESGPETVEPPLEPFVDGRMEG